ncbi:MAG TPA: hypothetical protein VFZ66_11845 [Herpetosiphonaceae bacterium]
MVYPRSREVMVHTLVRWARICSLNDHLENAEVVPGFTCTVADQFE